MLWDLILLMVALRLLTIWSGSTTFRPMVSRAASPPNLARASSWHWRGTGCPAFGLTATAATKRTKCSPIRFHLTGTRWVCTALSAPSTFPAPGLICWIRSPRQSRDVWLREKSLTRPLCVWPAACKCDQKWTRWSAWPVTIAPATASGLLAMIVQPFDYLGHEKQMQTNIFCHNVSLFKNYCRITKLINW